ncbi:MAG: MG2 domain-containing protein [Candidatus Aminicenantes bacterium]|nr:MG2 domain-containing protein [Candidatus Aminicenantes bacterium]
MKKTSRFMIAGLILLAIVSPGCKKKKIPQTTDWYRYISAYTSGSVSRKAQIRVLFVGNVGREGQDPSQLDGYLEFDPVITGKTEWKSARELVFTPAAELRPGANYKARLNTGKFMDLPNEYSSFEFPFSVIEENIELQLQGLTPVDETSPNQFFLRGTLTSRDSEDGSVIQKILAAEQEGKALAIEWTHSSDGQNHEFVIRAIERREKTSLLQVRWDGSAIGVDKKGSRAVDVPSLGQFDLLSAEAVSEPAPSILLRFSDPLKKNQDLQGLITVAGHAPTFEIEANVIRIYSSKSFDGSLEIAVNPGVRNYNDRRLAARVTRNVVFQRIAPQVRFVGKGVILPQKDMLTIPFEAVSLRAIQVTAFQIYSNNMAQFLQQNNLQGKENLAMVGRFLWRKTVPLSDKPEETAGWRRYSLDVTQLLKDNPGSLFRIILSFNRGNSTYACADSTTPPAVEPPFRNQDDTSYREGSYWDYAEGYYDEEQSNRNWDERNDPCRDAYYDQRYNSDLFPARNFLASNLGLIAKLEENLTLHVVSTDIRSGQPFADVEIRAMNFQNQLLAEGSTDGSGFLTLNLQSRPFFIEARQGKERGYLRLDQDGLLATSHFDVGGEKVLKGIRGAIYGERGVWRPGDTLYLTFVLFDRDRALPKEHPVTLELYNPKDQLIQTLKPTKSFDTFYCFCIETDEAALTGNWKARVTIGGMAFEQKLKIETVVPNRLKIAFNPGAQKLLAGEAYTGSISSQWLHGAPAANLKFDVTVKFSPRPTRFDRWPDFVFDDPAREFTAAEQSLASGELNEKGDASFPVTLEIEEAAPGMMDATFVSRVFEAGGDFSSDALTLPFHPYTSYVGIKPPKGDAARNMLLTDQDHVLQIITVDPDGKPASRSKLEVSLYKVEWKWWWDKSGDSLAQYASNSSHDRILQGTVSTKDGVGEWKFQVKYPAWGRYLVRVVDPESGHATGKIIFIDWPGWAGRAREESGAGATRLNFSADKERYLVGEKAVIFLPTAPQGQALVSLENGSSVLRQMWVSTKEGENRFEIELDENMTPNIYVHVLLLQPHSGKKSDTPIRLYGVIPILVDNPATRLEPQLKVAAELKPQEEFKVSVNEKDGRPMTYTLAVVDEGLLGLTRYSAPDLRQRFYNREALGILTWDLFDDVAEAYGAELSRLLALGGGEEGEGAGKEKKPRRFPPVVMFAGPFALERGKTAEHTLTMPQYIGAVRVMVVAGRDGAYGSAEKSVPVRQDLMILPTLPRVIRPDEVFDLPVSVFVSNPDIRSVQVSLTTSDLFLATPPTAKTVNFSAPGDKIVTFRINATSALGQGSVRIQASSGSRRAESEIHISVIAANPKLIESSRMEIPPGQTREIQVTSIGIKGTNEVALEASTLPPFQLQKRLQFLIHYPHGCLEQTLSTAFPQLYLKLLLKLSAEEQKQVEKHINVAIEKLRGFQTSSGGFSYWPGENDVHEWTSSYAGYFLLEAARLGFHVPGAMMEQWKKFQKSLANSWTEGDMQSRLNQADRLYTLALARDPDLGAMNRLREMRGLDSVATILLAGAFQASGQADAAEDLLKNCQWQVADYHDDRNTFGSALRDKAIVIRTLVEMGKADRAKKMVEEIARELGRDTWYSTQETAYSLMALAVYYGGSPANPFRFKMAWDKESGEEIVATVPFFQKLVSPFTAAERKLTVSNPGQNPLYLTIYKSGVVPAGREKAAESNIGFHVEYLNMAGEPLPMERLAQGSDFQVRISVSNLTQNNLSNLALTHMVPAGCQIANPRLIEGEPARNYFDYQDVRDDRIYTYLALNGGAKKTITVVLNASYSGKFYLPGIAIESMYDSAVHANSTGKWLEIVR